MASTSLRGIDVLIQHINCTQTQIPSTANDTALSKKLSQLLSPNSYSNQSDVDDWFTFHFAKLCDLLNIQVTAQTLDSFQDSISAIATKVAEDNNKVVTDLDYTIAFPMFTLLLRPYLHNDSLKDLKVVFQPENFQDIFTIPSRLNQFIQKHTPSNITKGSTPVAKRRRIESIKNLYPWKLLLIYLIARFGIKTISSNDQDWKDTKAKNWKSFLSAIYKAFPEEVNESIRSMVVCSALDLLSEGAPFQGTGFVLSPCVLCREIMCGYVFLNELDQFLKSQSFSLSFKGNYNVLIIATAATCLLQSHYHPNHNHPVDTRSASSKHAKLLFENGLKFESIEEYVNRTSSTYSPSTDQNWYQQYYYPILVYIRSYMLENLTLRAVEAIQILEKNDTAINAEENDIRPSELGWIVFFEILAQTERLVSVCKDLNMTPLGNKWFILYLTDIAIQSLEDLSATDDKESRLKQIIWELRCVCVAFYVARSDPQTALQKAEEASQEVLEHFPDLEGSIEPLKWEKEGVSPHNLALELFVRPNLIAENANDLRNEQESNRSISMSTNQSTNDISVVNMESVDQIIEEELLQNNVDTMVNNLKQNTSTGVKYLATEHIKGSEINDAHKNDKEIGQTALELTQTILRQFPDTSQELISSEKQENKEVSWVRFTTEEDAEMEPVPSGSENDEIQIPDEYEENETFEKNEECSEHEDHEDYKVHDEDEECIESDEYDENDIAEESRNEDYHENGGNDSGGVIEIDSSSEEENNRDKETESVSVIENRSSSSIEYKNDGSYYDEVNEDDQYVEVDDDTVTKGALSDQYEDETQVDTHSSDSGEYDSGEYVSQEETSLHQKEASSDEEHSSHASVENDSSEDEPMIHEKDEYDDDADQGTDPIDDYSNVNDIEVRMQTYNAENVKRNLLETKDNEKDEKLSNIGSEPKITHEHQQVERIGMTKSQENVTIEIGSSTETPQLSLHKQEAAYEADVSSREKSKKTTTFVAPAARTRFSRNLEEEKAYEADVEIEERITGLPAPLLYKIALDDDSKESSSVTMANSVQQQRIPGYLMNRVEINHQILPGKSAVTCEDEKAYEADADSTIDHSRCNDSSMRSKYSKVHNLSKKTATIEKEEQAYEADAELDGTDAPEDMYKSKKYASNLNTNNSGLEEKAYEADVEMDAKEAALQIHGTDIGKYPKSNEKENIRKNDDVEMKTTTNIDVDTKDALFTMDFNEVNDKDNEGRDTNLEQIEETEDDKATIAAVTFETTVNKDSLKESIDQKTTRHEEELNALKVNDIEVKACITEDAKEGSDVVDGLEKDDEDVEGNNTIDSEEEDIKSEQSEKERKIVAIEAFGGRIHEETYKESTDQEDIPDDEVQLQAKTSVDSNELTNENVMKEGISGDEFMQEMRVEENCTIDQEEEGAKIEQSKDESMQEMSVEEAQAIDSEKEVDIQIELSEKESEKELDEDAPFEEHVTLMTNEKAMNVDISEGAKEEENAEGDNKIHSGKKEDTRIEQSEIETKKESDKETKNKKATIAIDASEEIILDEDALTNKNTALDIPKAANESINEKAMEDDTKEEEDIEKADGLNENEENAEEDNAIVSEKEDENIKNSEKRNKIDEVIKTTDASKGTTYGDLLKESVDKEKPLDDNTPLEEKTSLEALEDAIELTNEKEVKENEDEDIEEVDDLEKEEAKIEEDNMHNAEKKDLESTTKQTRSKRINDTPMIRTRSSARAKEVGSRYATRKAGLPPIVPKVFRTKPKVKAMKVSKISSPSSHLSSPSKSKSMRATKLPYSPPKSPSPTKVRPMKISTRSSSKRRHETPASAKSTPSKMNANSSNLSVHSTGSSHRYSTRSRSKKVKADADDRSVASTIHTQHDPQETTDIEGKVSKKRNPFEIEQIAFTNDSKISDKIEPLSPPDSKRRRGRSKKSPGESSVRSTRSTRSSARLRSKK